MADNHTDIKHIIEKAHDVFDVSSWGSPEKETQPAPKEHDTHVEIQEAVEHEPDQTVQKYVQPIPHKPKVDKDIKELGVEPKHVVQYPTMKTVELPITDRNVLIGLKKPIETSYRWISETCKYLLRKSNIGLRVKKGKVERFPIKHKPAGDLEREPLERKPTDALPSTNKQLAA